MAEALTVHPIAHIHCDLPAKFGVPRQSGLVPQLRGTVVFTPAYRNPDALRGLDDFSHLWLLWHFSEAKHDGWSPTVRPPRLGGNRRMGVFATRSPFRPNPIGLSSVVLERIEWDTPQGPVLHIRGADLMDGTPIMDIKPYLAYADSHPNATGGFTDGLDGRQVTVEFSDEVLSPLTAVQRETLLSILAHDPRPSYQQDPTRVYGMAFADWQVHFTVADGILHIIDIL